MKRIALLAALGSVGMSVAAEDLTDLDPSRIYLFYLHGRIVEDAGPTPTHPVWGLYDYPAVVEALGTRGAVVVSEQRPKDTDIGKYAAKVVAEIDALVDAGVPESQIAVVGFSKGGAIATLVSASASNRHADVRYAILASCADWLADRPDLSMHGHVLTIFEASDDSTHGCRPLSDHQRGLGSASHLTIDTGAEHGAFYLPRDEWVVPTLRWVHGS